MHQNILDIFLNKNKDLKKYLVFERGLDYQKNNKFIMILEKNIDIIIPVYNEGELILETINSINQNFKLNCNIIICYDFDEDNTLKAIKKVT